MKWFRSVVSLVLVAIATLVVGCSSASVKAPLVYTPEKIAQIQLYAARIEASQARLPELANYIDKNNWTNTDNFIHGPLGELREQMGRVANLLLPEDKAQAQALAKDISLDLNALSTAAADFNYGAATSGFRTLEDDLADFLGLLPSA
jgi:photosystem II protein PsbQ